MDILEHMDALFESAVEQGQKPENWLIREQDWLAIGERYNANTLPDPSLVTPRTYRGVPVQFTNLREAEIVGIDVALADPVIATK
ncbi:hypothetical protein [Altererythrobacter sp. Root672]|uniref:hypothetical protein n=1 Tax=Altererythrobacter sp. Root672 TaxID=1736584 RepID=UPI0006F4FB67|nr:hypothetical protein [Altererythrobacter sp. Root672]KRA81631.1 hypothetical protein ASD76_14000 [Altererythrobacter sp. Root672]